MRQCCEYLKELQYKLRMMGIPDNNPCFIYGDNQSVLWNTSVPDSMYNKINHVDILTKNLPAGENRFRKVSMVLFDIFPNEKEN